MNIEHVVNEGGDWVVLKLNGEEFYSGHSVPDFVWMSLITEVAPFVHTSGKEVSDKDMEEGNY